ncbi:AraC family transcriptional regulator [Paraburkholderia sp. SIMBA_055]|jgi:AraC family transcriptional activator of mtrCDE|uniref:AraC family transcriptional activator of mtrCDE n=1 Tax=Paraburkholderia graminis TaxID=60548 RepID=A0ABD5CS70_9BURK|nr:AraC family transcriptional regulator [Paraburkholderia graminis]MDR6208052.1 AraC family transcriptional activator of mtrCDE [Paraburkholderia graminis]
MDSLSRVIRLARLQGSLDLRCELAGTFNHDHSALPPGEAQFHLVLSGSCMIEPESQSPVQLVDGDMAVFPTGLAHRLRDNGSTVEGGPMRHEHDGMIAVKRNAGGSPDLDLLCGRFHYSPASAGLLMSALPKMLHVSLTEVAGAEELRVLIGIIRMEARHKEQGALQVVTALSNALFAIAMRAYMEQGNQDPGVLTLLADSRLGASARAILEDPARAWTVDALAEISAMSRATYARAFGKKAGMTPWEFLTRLRIHMATDMLIHTRRSTADIASDVGYQSEVAFSRAFRQYAGVTPAQIRRQTE